MLLGLDLGTTNVKAIVADRCGRSVAAASRSVPLVHGSDHSVEQDLDVIWGATLDVLRDVAQAAAGQRAPPVAALGVSSQGGALVLLDPRGAPLGPVCSWLDPRGAVHDAALTDQLGSSWFSAHVGHRSAALAIGQLLRLRRVSPAWLAPPNRVGFVGDAIVARLCGMNAHDATSAAITLLFNPVLDQYDPELLGHLGLGASQLPSVLPATRPAGLLLGEVAALTGLPAAIPVSPAVHDQYAAALGNAAVRPGDALFGAGTAWVILLVTPSFLDPVHSDAFAGPHLVNPLFGQILSLRNGGSAHHWMVQTLGLGNVTPEELERRAASVGPGAGGVRFRPFLAETVPAGVRPGMAGRLDGLRLGHSSAHLLRAVEEGLACELARHLVLARRGGVVPARLMMSGGPAQRTLAPQLIANATGLPVHCGPGAGSALGAAMIARALIEPGASLAAIAGQMRGDERIVTPDQHAELYAGLASAYIGEIEGAFEGQS